MELYLIVYVHKLTMQREKYLIFWLIAMRYYHLLHPEVSYLSIKFFFYFGIAMVKYLTDIKWSGINDSEELKLEFTCGPNPDFKNSVLE